MVMTPSNMIPLNTPAADFSLLDVISEKPLSLAEIRGKKATVIMFICNHCPFVKHIADEIAELADDYITKGIGFAAISANDADSYPQDAPEKMVEFSEEKGFVFPYLYDETQEAAIAYQAACTPEFYIFDQNLKCVYRGQFDGSHPGNNVPVSGDAIRNALEQLLVDKPVDTDQKPSIGCNIKWKQSASAP